MAHCTVLAAGPTAIAGGERWTIRAGTGRSLEMDPATDYHQGYVAGFCFDADGRVALVRKNRPQWQAGRLNGIGGKIETGEEAAAAMRREFREEAGVDLDGWERFATIHFDGGHVAFYRLFVDDATFGRIRSCTDEAIEIHDAATVAALGEDELIPQLTWLIPLACYHYRRYDEIVVTQLDG